jgi:vitamin B12 transporter
VYAEYKLSKGKIKLFADFRNITNSQFIEISGFNTLGFNAYGGLRFNF